MYLYSEPKHWNWNFMLKALFCNICWKYWILEGSSAHSCSVFADLPLQRDVSRWKPESNLRKLTGVGRRSCSSHLLMISQCSFSANCSCIPAKRVLGVHRHKRIRCVKYWTWLSVKSYLPTLHLLMNSAMDLWRILVHHLLCVLLENIICLNPWVCTFQPCSSYTMLQYPRIFAKYK